MQFYQSVDNIVAPHATTTIKCEEGERNEDGARIAIKMYIQSKVVGRVVAASIGLPTGQLQLGHYLKPPAKHEFIMAAVKAGYLLNGVTSENAVMVPDCRLDDKLIRIRSEPCESVADFSVKREIIKDSPCGLDCHFHVAIKFNFNPIGGCVYTLPEVPRPDHVQS